LSELIGSFNITIFVAEEIDTTKLGIDTDAKTSIINYPKIPKYLLKFSSLVQMTSLWKFRDRSMNHLTRANFTFGNKQTRGLWECVVVHDFRISPFKRLLVRALSAPLVYPLVRIFEHQLFRMFGLAKFKSVWDDFRVMIIPFSGHIGPHFSTSVWMSRKLGIHSLALQENWDNLSTKTFVTEEPDTFGVWGEQSLGHLRGIHQLRSCKVELIGTPRFKNYFSRLPLNPTVSIHSSGELLSLRDQNFILITGTGDGLDDIVLLEVCVRSLGLLQSENQARRDSVKIVYRPHPNTRLSLNHELLHQRFSEIFIDAGPNSRIFGHVDALVQNSLAVVNLASTLTIEGVICNRFVICPSFIGNQRAKYNYENIMNEWHHQFGLKLIPNIFFPKSELEMSNTLANVIKANEQPSKVNWEWICYPTNYFNEISRILYDIFKMTSR
jgi:hypothetical protein